jgi:hypothetical protein
LETYAALVKANADADLIDTEWVNPAPKGWGRIGI